MATLLWLGGVLVSLISLGIWLYRLGSVQATGAQAKAAFDAQKKITDDFEKIDAQPFPGKSGVLASLRRKAGLGN